MKSETIPHTQRAMRDQRKADHCRLLGGSCDKQEDFLLKVVLGCHKTSRSLPPGTRILKVYTKVLFGNKNK